MAYHPSRPVSDTRRGSNLLGHACTGMILVSVSEGANAHLASTSSPVTDLTFHDGIVASSLRPHVYPVLCALSMYSRKSPIMGVGRERREPSTTRVHVSKAAVVIVPDFPGDVKSRSLSMQAQVRAGRLHPTMAICRLGYKRQSDSLTHRGTQSLLSELYGVTTSIAPPACTIPNLSMFMGLLLQASMTSSVSTRIHPHHVLKQIYGFNCSQTFRTLSSPVAARECGF